MTLDVGTAEVQGDAPSREPALPAAPSPAAPSPAAPSTEGIPAVAVPHTCLAAFLAASGAAWLAAGLFAGWLPRVVAVLGAAIGSGTILLSYRSRQTTVVQLLVVPVAVVAGALLLLPAAGGDGSLPGLVGEALQQGGLGQPPVPFDPGWRFLLLVFASLLGAAAAGVAVGMEGPRLSLLIPLVVLFVAALVQPSAGAAVSGGVALLLMVGGLVVCYGVELRRQGATSGEFEARRLIRAAGALVLVVAALGGLNQAGFLFPSETDELVIPPQRPRPQPEQADRVLFTVSAPRALPWRLGVLDVYDGTGWLTAPLRGSRLVAADDGRALPSSSSGAARVEPMRAAFTVVDLPGRALPGLAMPVSVESSEVDVLFDPRTQALRLGGTRAKSGSTYTVEAAPTPSRADLAVSSYPPAEMEEFLEVPPPPPEVAALLESAPPQPGFARLQSIREAFYREVVAAGEGSPADVTPERVVEMLEGKEATPYEITAAEALLARWSGVPARIGFGYFGGQPVAGRADIFEVRPKNGATWLEAYFDGFGWVPVVGTPPRAKGGLKDGSENTNSAVQATDELALVVYVPLRSQSIRQTYLIVRYWIAVTLPWVAGAGLVVAVLPAAAKAARRVRRRRWARALGPRARIGASYADFRDTALDLGIGAHAASPLELVACFEPDDEHTEMAWLVTRAVWGDLSRDLTDRDAEVCEDMCDSLRRRALKANPVSTRLLAATSRASLRDPYSCEVPNLWPARRFAVSRLPAAALRGVRRRFRLGVRRVLPGSAVLLLVACVASVISACGTGDRGRVEAASRATLREPVAPEAVGPYRVTRAEGVEAAFRDSGPDSLVGEGHVYVVEEAGTIQASVQIAEFKPGLDVDVDELHEGIRRSIATGRFERTRIGRERVWALDLPEQRMLLWFSPDGGSYQLMVARRRFDEADQVFRRLVAYQRGETELATDETPVVPPDPRRGLFAREASR